MMNLEGEDPHFACFLARGLLVYTTGHEKSCFINPFHNWSYDKR